jgi:transposase InsO family protein
LGPNSPPPAGAWSACSPITATSSAAAPSPSVSPAGTRHRQIRSGRPQTNGHVERLHRTILEECWRPAFARYHLLRFNGLGRDLAAYLHDYNHDREHHRRITAGRCPAELVSGARKMEPK